MSDAGSLRRSQPATAVGPRPNALFQ